MRTIRTFVSCLVASAVIALVAITVSGGTPAQAVQICPMMWQPVCGIWKDGKKHMWANDCWAGNDMATHVKPGPCGK
jgi:hypothetical protein